MKTKCQIVFFVLATQLAANSQDSNKNQAPASNATNTLLVQASDADKSWKTIEDTGDYLIKSGPLIAACSQFIKSYPTDKRVEQAHQKIDKVTRTLQSVPQVARDQGIPLASGFGVNLAGVPIFGGKIDLKHSGSAQRTSETNNKTKNENNITRSTTHRISPVHRLLAGVQD